jgi:hypothetical protein
MNQQVNNDAATTNESVARGNFAESSNELLEFEQGERLDFGAAATAGATDSTLETVGAILRPQDDRR